MKPFGAARAIVELHQASTHTSYARLFDDGRSILVSHFSAGGCDATCDPSIYFASRPSDLDAFGPLAPVILGTLNDVPSQQAGTITNDGLTIVFAGDPRFSAKLIHTLYIERRTTITANFSPPVMLAPVYSWLPVYGRYYHEPYLTPDGSALYFSYAEGITL